MGEKKTEPDMRIFELGKMFRIMTDHMKTIDLSKKDFKHFSELMIEDLKNDAKEYRKPYKKAAL
ncbi:MAG: hypothetical protein V1913_05100 [Fibrobacterota bacterium]